ncbi:MAG TPA: ACP synthase [Polyangia bacterium]|jgi:hypothetical protein|nr:ACP synthase [Polyangia bacterium]
MNGQLREGHVGDLALRRLRAGEVIADAAHADACADCRARRKALDEEQHRFEQEISFDRFAAGVERAARRDDAPLRAARWTEAPRRATLPASKLRTLRFMLPTLSLAAGVALFVGLTGRHQAAHNGLKGGAAITVRVSAGDTGPQRFAAESAPEALAPGERVRIGYQPGPRRYLLSLSIDEHGQVTPLYPEAGSSVAVSRAVGDGLRYLPDSIEFTDAGAERLFVILSDQPIDVTAARRAARASFDRAKGDILHMPSLELPGEQFQRTFIKP